MHLPDSVKRLFVSEDGTAEKIEYLVMLGSLIVLCMLIFEIADTVRDEVNVTTQIEGP
jgi:hypothetical protein